MSALKRYIDCTDWFGVNGWLFQFVSPIWVNFRVKIVFLVLAFGCLPSDVSRVSFWMVNMGGEFWYIICVDRLCLWGPMECGPKWHIMCPFGFLSLFCFEYLISLACCPKHKYWTTILNCSNKYCNLVSYYKIQTQDLNKHCLKSERPLAPPENNFTESKGCVW